MAKILNFRTSERRDEDSVDARERASAQVIVFPGVRYEHWEQPGAAPVMPATTKRRDHRRRDVLELAE